MTGVKNVDLFLLFCGTIRQNFTKATNNALLCSFLVYAFRFRRFIRKAILWCAPEPGCVKTQGSCFFQTCLVAGLWNCRAAAKYPKRVPVG